MRLTVIVILLLLLIAHQWLIVWALDRRRQMRSLPLAIDRTTGGQTIMVDARDPYARLRGLEAQLDAARRLIRELEAKLGERPAGEAGL